MRVRKPVLSGLFSTVILLIGAVAMCNSKGFAAQWNPSPGPPEGVVIGDFNNDGVNEIAFANYGSNYGLGTVDVYDRFGVLTYQWTGLNFPTGVAIGDYDNDGLNEVAWAEEGFERGLVSVYKWRPPPYLPILVYKWTGLEEPQGVAIGDYDNDGLDELACASMISGDSGVSQVTVYDWKFSPVLLKIVQDTNADGSNRDPWGVAIGDYNGDGYKDLAFTEVSGGKVIVYRWGDLGSLVGGIPTYFAYDDKVDGIDLALFIQCYKKSAPANAMYLADIGGGFLGPKFFAFDGNVNGYDLSLFLQCFKGLGP